MYIHNPYLKRSPGNLNSRAQSIEREWYRPVRLLIAIIVKKWTYVKCTSSLTATQYDKCVNENSDFSFICNECSIRCLPFYLSDFPDDDQKKTFKKKHICKIMRNVLTYSKIKATHDSHQRSISSTKYFRN
jgi:hypothetical protein